MKKLPKFIARLYRDIGKGNTLQEFKDYSVDYNKLLPNKNKLKPYMTFRIKKRTFVYLPEAIRSYNKKGLPILRYNKDNSIVNDGKVKSSGRFEGTDVSPLQPISKDIDTEREQSSEERKIASDVFDLVFAQGEEKNVIAGSQKPKDELDKKAIIIGAGLGAGLMFAIITILTANGIHI